MLYLIDEDDQNDEKLDGLNNIKDVNMQQMVLDAVKKLNFDEWSHNLIKFNNGRVLIKIEINFNQFTIKSLSVGSIVMRDEKIKLIGYDHTRSAVIYDTVPSRDEQKNISDTSRYATELNRLEIRSSPVMMGTTGLATIRIHEFRMMRLNDLVDQWKHVF